jgi:membrane-associated PAP2 superfamily phosphatase
MTNLKTLPQIKKIDWLIASIFAMLCASLCFFNYSNFDLKFQAILFDWENKTWLFDRNEPIKKFFFYNLPKVLFGAGIVLLFVNYLRLRNPRHLLILLGLIFIPLIAGNIKKFTNVYCPNQLEIYGGKYPYVKIFDSYPLDFAPEKPGQCFPAGHCVTGFALMILFFAFAEKKSRFFGLFAGIISGWVLGFYQIARGAHFFGDTFVSMILCFLLAALIYKFFYRFLKLQND